MDKLVEDYIGNFAKLEVNRAACRLLLLTLPGFEVQPTFQSFGSRLVPKLVGWAKKDTEEPLSCLAIGLLGLAMESSEIAGEHKDTNYELVPLIIQKMHVLWSSIHDPPTHSSPPLKRGRFSSFSPTCEMENGDSRSSFTSEVDIRPGHRLHPITDKKKLVLFLQYLIPMAEYFEHLQAFIERNVLNTVLEIVEFGDSILKLETLKLLSSLLCHNKVAIIFVNSSGLEKLVAVPKGSRAAAAVAVCLYYLAYNNDVMERLIQQPKVGSKSCFQHAFHLQ